MKLILNGGGVGEKCKTSYKRFAELLAGGKVLFVPFANDEMTYSEAFEWFKNEVNSVGISDIEMINTPEELNDKLLKKFAGVYISGGNTFLLLKELKKCSAFKVLEDYLKTNCIIMGGSAGATIFGKSIDTCLRDDLNIIASDDNYVNLKETSGLNVIGGYSFFVHYRVKERQYEATEERVKRLLKDGHKLLCLPEETSIYIDDSCCRIIGDAPAELITASNRKILNQNDKVNFEENNLMK